MKQGAKYILWSNKIDKMSILFEEIEGDYMAKFNGNIYKSMEESEQKEEIMKILPILQEILNNDDFEKLREDYHNGNNDDISFWKFVFEHVELKYIG